MLIIGEALTKMFLDGNNTYGKLRQYYTPIFVFSQPYTIVSSGCTIQPVLVRGGWKHFRVLLDELP